MGNKKETEIEDILKRDNEYRVSFEQEYRKWGDGDFLTSDVENFLENFFEKREKGYPFNFYRYSRANETNLQNIENEVLYLNYADRLNDMFEGMSLGTHTNGIVNYATKMVCFSVLKDNPLMWGHYAENGSGICVEYDFNKLTDDNLIRKRLIPVIYSENRVDIGKFKLDEQDEIIEKCLLCENMKDECLDRYLKDSHERFEKYGESLTNYIFKYKDWSYEKEWRVIFDYFSWLDDKNCSGNELDIKGCIKNIYLGPRFKDAHMKQRLSEIVKKINKKREKEDCVKLFETEPSETAYRVETVREC